MIKKGIILYIALILALIFSSTMTTAADNYISYGVFVDNAKLDQSVSVQAFNGFDYISISQLKSNLSITIKEDKATDSILISNKIKTIKITKNTFVEVNGEKSQLDVPVISKNNNIYVPIAAFVDLLGYEIEIMDDVKCIRIKTKAEAVLVGKLVDAELVKAIPASKTVSSIYPRVAYLTFDDGLDKTITPLVLDILKENNVKATFFIVGNTIERNKDLLKRMIAEGHSIGNHTYTHRKELIYSSPEGLKNELAKTNNAIYNAIGIRTDLFRPPYGGTYIKGEDQKAVLTAYRTILWNVDSMDSRGKGVSSATILNNVINQVKNKKSANIIMHDSSTHMETVKALPGIIKHLKDNGFTMLPIKANTSFHYGY